MFQGYTNETFEFFMAIRFNNNRDFFHANYEWYQRAVRQPSLDLAQDLNAAIEEIDPDLERRPYRCLSHINRDVRFSNDKSPYRDYLWISFKHPGPEADRLPAFYYDMSDEGASFGMGFYRDNPECIRALRRRMEQRPETVLKRLEDIGDFDLEITTGRRTEIPDTVPAGLRAWYAAKNFYFTQEIKDFDRIKSPALADTLREGFKRLAPVYRLILNPDAAD